ncbi:DUF4334 domain-containing protein [Micromonospora sp. KC721]|uniref:DUF4334 domain-containing protein n=1 Tax=Micromonospora sp. KC721 TaxID=2530380 RepID=UPI001FB69E7C|nr:DUF4334 domain-containing protein [Micromonospora sp. KC721]
MTADHPRRSALNDLRAKRDIRPALRYFDSLAPVTVREMLGRWRGIGLATRHPMDGLLERSGWYGKRFETPEAAHPLLFGTAGGNVVSLDPALIPLGSLLRFPRLAHLPIAAQAFRLVRPLLTTTRPTARLRMTEYRGVVTATMCYDTLPVHDVFRRIDDDTVLGAMDTRGSPHPFMFVLTRDEAR